MEDFRRKLSPATPLSASRFKATDISAAPNCLVNIQLDFITMRERASRGSRRAVVLSQGFLVFPRFQIGATSAEHCSRIPLSLKISSVASSASFRLKTISSLYRPRNLNSTNSSVTSRSVSTRCLRLRMAMPFTSARASAYGPLYPVLIL